MRHLNLPLLAAIAIALVGDVLIVWAICALVRG